MSRYKAVKPQLENTEVKQMQKRERIRKAIEIIYVMLMIAGIFVCGINQHNALMVGWGMFIMGSISLPTAIFYIYIERKGWKPLFWYDCSEGAQYISKQTKEKDLKECHLVRGIITIVLTLFSVGLPVFGILCLLALI